MITITLVKSRTHRPIKLIDTSSSRFQIQINNSKIEPKKRRFNGPFLKKLKVRTWLSYWARTCFRDNAHYSVFAKEYNLNWILFNNIWEGVLLCNRKKQY